MEALHMFCKNYIAQGEQMIAPLTHVYNLTKRENNINFSVCVNKEQASETKRFSLEPSPQWKVETAQNRETCIWVLVVRELK